MTVQSKTITSISHQESNSIKIMRVIATFMIVSAHICNAVGTPIFNAASQLFQIGVPIFFILSAYIFSKRSAAEFEGRWILKRIMRLQIPVVVFDVLWATYLVVIEHESLSLIGCIGIILNVAGFHTNMGLVCGSNEGMFWFTSYIMLCYFITPIAAKLKAKIGRKKLFLISTIVFVIYNTICIFNRSDTAFFYRFNYVLLYLAVLLYSDSLVKAFGKCNWKYSLNLTGILILTLAVRMLVGRISYSPTVEILYTSVVAQISGYIMALYACSFVFMLSKFLSAHDYLMKFVAFLDKCSYEVYITHGMCISVFTGCFQNSMEWFVIETAVVFCAAILAALILHAISDPIYRKVVAFTAKEVGYLNSLKQ